MKFSLVSLLAGATLVAANPLLIVVSSHVEQISNGQVATINTQPHPVPVHPTPSHRKPCGAGAAAAKIQEQALSISNAFRHALGLDRPHPDHPRPTQAVNVPNSLRLAMLKTAQQMDAEKNHKGHIAVGNKASEIHYSPPFWIETAAEQNHKDKEHHHKHHPHHHHDKEHHRHHHKGSDRPPFWARVNAALRILGPWESRAVAFVVGCGIGVLLRMFFVMTIVLIRTIRGGGSRQEEHIQYQVLHVYEDDDAEELAVPPPQYLVDEKVLICEALA